MADGLAHCAEKVGDTQHLRIFNSSLLNKLFENLLSSIPIMYPDQFRIRIIIASLRGH